MTIIGKAWVFGDNIDTDVLAPGIYLKLGPEDMAQHCLEAVDPKFAGAVQPGDIVVGGKNFGMGSSREQAPQALKILGIGAIVAMSFARIFYRNALNLGLPVVSLPQAAEIAAGDNVSVDPVAGSITNTTQHKTYSCDPIPAHLLEMIADGGLMPHLKKKIDAGLIT